MKARAYSASTVLDAHRRVLQMVVETLAEMSKKERYTLRTRGDGIVTLEEVLEHAEQALTLRVRKVK